MARTYRSSKIWVWFLLMLPLGIAIALFFVVGGTWLLVVTLMGDYGGTPRWFQLSFAAVFWMFSVGGAVWIFGALDAAYELTLTEDGTCEFRSLIRRKRVPGSWIVSVELDDGMTIVRHHGGRLHLLEPDDFNDFLARLKRLSPALSVQGPERWRSAAQGS